MTDEPKRKGPRRPSRSGSDFYALPHTGVTVAETIAAAAGETPTNSQPAPADPSGPVGIEAPLEQLVADPHNPRDPGDASDLESIRDPQYQAASAITTERVPAPVPRRAARRRGQAVGGHRGSRRLKAARVYGRASC